MISFYVMLTTYMVVNYHSVSYQREAIRLNRAFFNDFRFGKSREKDLYL